MNSDNEKMDSNAYELTEEDPSKIAGGDKRYGTLVLLCPNCGERIIPSLTDLHKRRGISCPHCRLFEMKCDLRNPENQRVFVRLLR